MVDEGMTPESATDSGGEARGSLLDDMRRELEDAAGDLERLPQQLHERTGLVEHFEALVDELLGLLAVPVVLLDEHARVAGLSRGAVKLVDDPAGAMGRAASSVLPSPLSKEVTAYVRHSSEDGGAGHDGDGDGGHDRTTVRFLALPGRSTLVVVDR
jgi:hypothetical protein